MKRRHLVSSYNIGAAHLIDRSLLVLLAWDFDIRNGHVEVTVPDVFTGDDYSLVCKYLIGVIMLSASLTF